MSNPLFSLDRTVLQTPLQSVISEVAPRRVLPEEIGTALYDSPIATESAFTPNPLFAGLPTARPYRSGGAARSFLAGVRGTTATPVDKNYQRNLTSLENKYNELEPFLNTLPAHVRNALIQLDTTRVSRGSSPLTQEQTVKAASTAVSGRAATPVPDRASGIGGIFSNVRSDLSDILKSLPRLPSALLHEVSEIPRFSQRMQEAQEQGANPLSALLQAPGIRFLPGAYAASNILEGNFGELVQHPLFTALDVAPFASRAAGSTRLAQQVQRANVEQAATLSRSLGRALPAPPARPLSAVLMNRLDPLAPGGVRRSTLGRNYDRFIQETPVGQRLESAFGKRSRQVSQLAGRLEQRQKMFMMGYGTPSGAASALEAQAARIVPLFKKWEKEYPFLSTARTSPKVAAENRIARAGFYETLRTAPDQINPAFVDDIRNLLNDQAAYEFSLDKLGKFDNEFYAPEVADQLTKAQDRMFASERMSALRNEYLNPSGKLNVADFDRIAADIPSLPKQHRMDAARALEQTLDAYGIEIKPMKGRRASLSLDTGNWNDWLAEVRASLTDSNLVFRQRASMERIIEMLRGQKMDPQAKALEVALANNNVSQVTRFLDNLYSRKPPTFDPQVYASLRDDIRSMSRRRKFDAQIGGKRARQLDRRRAAYQRLLDQSAPARFGPLLARETFGAENLRTGTVAPGRVANELRAQAEARVGRLSPEQAGEFARNVFDRQWQNLPGLDPQFASDYAARVQREVSGTWRTLRESGHDPVFVHKVSPHRAQEGMQGKVGPVPTDETHLRERAVDLTPDEIRDVQVSLTHQAAESLSRAYSEQFIDEVIKTVGIPESQLQAHFLGEARRTASQNPAMTARGWLQKLTRDSYRRFNPDEAGFSWGGERFNNFYKENAYYIPTAIFDNLKRYAKRPSLFSSAVDPITKAFRYNVIGLSPSIIINNFFSNSVAMTAERGIRPWKHFNTAWQWAKNPTSAQIPDTLRAQMLAEIPHMEHLGMDAYLTTRTGSKLMSGVNARHAFDQSAAAEAVKAGKSALDGVVEKSLKLQRLGDNVYRAMIYLDSMERSGGKALRGTARETAEATAMELVNRTLVDYTSFTPIERNAIRQIIPFYSYMGHAARFIARYPLNHPMRAAITARVADFERERLGTLPGSFLSFLPIGNIDNMGKMNFLNLRPFDPFGDQADLLSISGWVAAANPAIQIALRQIGVNRGEAEIYPTLRYDPETGRMTAVKPNLLTDAIMTTVPRIGLLASLAGINPDYNELRGRDQSAADRSLAAQAGLPRLWRQFNVPQEVINAEVTRQRVEGDVLNEAMRSGDWTEALRYPNLRAYYEQVKALSPEELAAMTPAEPEALAGVVSEEILG